MTYAEIEARIIADLNRTDLNASIVGYVNDVYREMLSREDWQWLTTTTEALTEIDEWRYELPTDYGDSRSLVVIDGTNAEQIPYITPEEFDRLFPSVSTDTSGTPRVYTVRHVVTEADEHSDEINVWPKSDKATYVMQLWYNIKVVDLSGSLVPVIPVEYHSILVFGGLETAFARLREYDAAAFWMKKKELIFAAMLKNNRKYPSNAMLKPFSPKVLYPAEYWKNYTVRSVE